MATPSSIFTSIRNDLAAQQNLRRVLLDTGSGREVGPAARDAIRAVDELVAHLHATITAANFEITVGDLLPGDEVQLPFGTGIHVTHYPHPLSPPLQLVIWRVRLLDSPDAEWSFDSLTSTQVVGTYIASDPVANLIQALHPNQF